MARAPRTTARTFTSAGGAAAVRMPKHSSLNKGLRVAGAGTAVVVARSDRDI
jgi:hypothetical protein